MKNRTAITALILAGSLATASCGITYVSPSLRNQTADVPVRVLEMSPQSVLRANRSPYTPRSLPREFYAAAGAGSRRGADALPEPPFVPEERVEALALRVPPSVDPGPYRIGVGDVVLLSTNGGTTIEELSGLLAAETQRQGFTVRDDGTISIPDVGAVRIAGMTLEQAEMQLFETLLENEVDPDFSLEVAEFNSQKAVIGGAVRQPQPLPIGLQPLTLELAVAAAGGLTVEDEEFASIRILREGTLYQIPVEDYLQRQDLQRTRLLPGDAVYVDLSYNLERALRYYEQQLDVIALRSDTREQALRELEAEIAIQRDALEERRANFEARLDLDAEARDYVYLAGEVEKQARVPLPYERRASLADVLYEAGGVDTRTGNPAQVYVLRPSPDPAEFGAVTAWHLDASNPASITLATRFEMRPDDIVFVEEQPITKWNRALSQIFPVLVGNATRAVTD